MSNITNIMMNKKLLTMLFLSVVAVYSCTEKPVNIPDFVIPDSDRVVLVEEFTGVRCPNCPSGAATLDDLLFLYEDQIVVIAVHGGFDTEPLDASKYDFRTEESIEYEKNFNLIAKPSAAFNRVERNGMLAQIGINTWGGYLSEEVEKPHLMNIELENSFNAETRELMINIGFIPITDLSGNYTYNIALTESHIFDAQLNQSEVIEAYEHNHVFRKMLTELAGDPLGSDLKANEIITKSTTYVLPQDEELWVAENCHVVVFASELDGDSKIVLQAAEANVTQ
jgi:thiol-disulfide isomerase/thioredoxin